MATEEQLTPDERTIFAELEKVRGVPDTELFPEFLAWGRSQSNFKVSAGRLASYFNLTKSDQSLLQDL
jgi:hypothetical protein